MRTSLRPRATPRKRFDLSTPSPGDDLQSAVSVCHMAPVLPFLVFFGEKARRTTKKQGFFIPTEPLKSLEKRAKTLKKNNEILTRENNKEFKKKREEGQGLFTKCYAESGLPQCGRAPFRQQFLSSWKWVKDGFLSNILKWAQKFRNLREGWNCRFQKTPRTEGGDKVPAVWNQVSRQICLSQCPKS